MDQHENTDSAGGDCARGDSFASSVSCTSGSTSCPSLTSSESRNGRKRSWDEMYSSLVSYRGLHGDCLVPYRYGTDRALGTWVATQRRQYKLLSKGEKSLMTTERKRKLHDIGFVWEVHQQVPWETRYQELLAYKKEHGNCTVPIGYEKNKQLSNWVSKQRQEYQAGRLSEDKILALNKVGFLWKVQPGIRSGGSKIPVPSKILAVKNHAAEKQQDSLFLRGLPAISDLSNAFTRGHEEPVFRSAAVPKSKVARLGTKQLHSPGCIECRVLKPCSESRPEGLQDTDTALKQSAFDAAPHSLEQLEKDLIGDPDMVSMLKDLVQDKSEEASTTSTSAPCQHQKFRTTPDTPFPQEKPINIEAPALHVATMTARSEEGGKSQIASPSSVADSFFAMGKVDGLHQAVTVERPALSPPANTSNKPPLLESVHVNESQATVATSNKGTKPNQADIDEFWAAFPFKNRLSLDEGIQKRKKIVLTEKRGGHSVSMRSLQRAELAVRELQQLAAFRDGLASLGGDVWGEMEELEKGRDSACNNLDFSAAQAFQLKVDTLRKDIKTLWFNSLSKKNGVDGCGLETPNLLTAGANETPGANEKAHVSATAERNEEGDSTKPQRCTNTMAYPVLIDSSREMMRLAMSKPHFDPQKISYQYLEQCTDKFSEKRELGQGSFSHVYLGIDKILRRKFAVKRLRVKLSSLGVDLDEAKKTFQREILTQKEFHHPNIARLYAFYMSDDIQKEPCLVFELASKGSLNLLLEKESGKAELHWTRRVSIALDIARALQYLHKGRGGQVCFHRDVKSANVCLKRDFTALLIDCGVSNIVSDDESKSTMTIMDSKGKMRGTPGYMCPTYARTLDQYEGSSDVFSLGIVLVELITGILQFSEVGEEKIDLFDRYSDDGSEQRQLERDADANAGDWDAHIRDNYAQLAVECISQVPRKRPKIDDVVQRVERLSGLARPWSPSERNLITVLFSGPLVYRNASGRLEPIRDSPNFRVERDMLTQCIKEAKRDITLNFDVATSDRLQVAATKRSGCLHISGHGHPECLVFEDGAGGAHFLETGVLRDLLPFRETFKLVFVSACHSESIGQQFLNAGARHVVCCDQDSRVRDDAAMRFTHALYLALAEGFTIKASFHVGKMAVKTEFGLKEMKKFLLLPADGNHDEIIFNAEKLEWNDDSACERTIPAPPKPFWGRQTDMYRLLQLILSRRLVTLAGESGIGCSSLAAAICQYIDHRKTIFLDIEVIYFVRRSAGGENADALTVFLKPLHAQLVKDGRTSILSKSSDIHSYTVNLVNALSSLRALVVFDGADSQDEWLLYFVGKVLEGTNRVKILLTAQNPVHCSTLGLDEYVYQLGPLAFDDGVRLFSEVCPHTQSSLRISECRDDQLSSFERIGGGVPARIIMTAKSMTEEEYQNLTTEK